MERTRNVKVRRETKVHPQLTTVMKVMETQEDGSYIVMDGQRGDELEVKDNQCDDQMEMKEVADDCP